jgi:hypothetical protein
VPIPASGTVAFAPQESSRSAILLAQLYGTPLGVVVIVGGALVYGALTPGRRRRGDDLGMKSRSWVDGAGSSEAALRTTIGASTSCYVSCSSSSR